MDPLVATENMEMAIELQGITKQFGDFSALAGIDLQVPRGICFGLLGPNGAGKTTAIRIIQGGSDATSGSAKILGLDPKTQSRELKSKLGVVGQEDNLDPDFTVENNLAIFSAFFGIPKEVAKKRATELLVDFNLEAKAKGTINELSGGMKRRLVIARALVNNPEMLVLDEPTTGLDPQARQDLWRQIRRLRRKGVTILLTTHYMDEAEVLCDELVVIDQGKILDRGTPRGLIERHTTGRILELIFERDAAKIAMESHNFTDSIMLDDRVVIRDNFDAALEQLTAEDRELVRVLDRRATLEDVFLQITGRTLRD